MGGTGLIRGFFFLIKRKEPERIGSIDSMKYS
jgi:hypothetical protein